MLYVLPSNNPQSDATGALPVILHTAVGFREGHSGSLFAKVGKNVALETKKTQLHKAENLVRSRVRTEVYNSISGFLLLSQCPSPLTE